MKLLDEIKAIDIALYANKTLILSDLHIGYEESLNQKGILIPRQSFQEIIKRLEKVFERIKQNIQTIILNGDLKHEFGTISQTEWRNCTKLIQFLKRKCEEIIIIKGNHDTIAEPIAQKENVVVKQHHILKTKKSSILITHGDKKPQNLKKIDTLIIGHIHPAITLRKGVREEKYKCYLVGKYEKKNLIIQPSCNPLTQGTDILSERIIKPYERLNPSDFSVYVVSDKVYNFGKVKELQKAIEE